MKIDQVTILGVPFFRGSVEEAVERALKGGLVLVPSGPGLACDLPASAAYRAALEVADLVLPDSGAMVIAWNLLKFRSRAGRLERVSGLKFLRALLSDARVVTKLSTFWVMPSPAEQEINLRWLREHGFTDLRDTDCYVAPQYRFDRDEVSASVEDPELARTLDRRRPDIVFLNVGSGVQEPLGAYLKATLNYCPTIVCSGAAIAFLTGQQANIPVWADRFYLGWLLRIVHSPTKFGRRYLRAFRLFRLLARYGSQAPPAVSAIL